MCPPRQAAGSGGGGGSSDFLGEKMGTSGISDEIPETSLSIAPRWVLAWRREGEGVRRPLHVCLAVGLLGVGSFSSLPARNASRAAFLEGAGKEGS